MIIRSGKPRNIAIHHSAVKTVVGDMAELKARVASHNIYHKTKSEGWNNTTPGEYGYKWIRYHWAISKNGDVIQLQDEKYVLYHSSDGVTGEFNYWGIAILFEGNFSEEKPTEAMMRAAVELIRNIQTRYNIDPKVRGHREIVANTGCPGSNLGTSQSGWLKTLITNVNNPKYPPVIVVPPAPPEPTDCELEVKRLEDEINKMSENIGALEIEVRMGLDRVQFLEGSLKLTNDELKETEEELTKAETDRDTYERERNEAIAGSLLVATTGEIFAELWKRIKRSIK